MSTVSRVHSYSNVAIARLIFLAVSAMLFCNAPCNGQSLAEAWHRSIDYRSSMFNECYVEFTAILTTKSGSEETAVKAWVKGDKIRNDVRSVDGVGQSIVSGDTYICLHPGDKTPVVALCSERPDIWQHLGIVNPASIGATLGGMATFRGGKHDWLLESLIRGGTADRIEPVGQFRYVFQQERLLPLGVPVPALLKFDSPEEFLLANPGTDTVSLEITTEASFSEEAQGQLVSYKVKQSRLDGSMKSDILLTNQFKYHEDANAWFPSKSEWLQHYNGEEYQRRITTVNLVKLDSVDDIVFTVEGLGLADGTSIRDLSSGLKVTYGQITEGKLVFPEHKQIEMQPSEGVSPEKRNRTLVFLGTNLILIAAILAVFWYRSGRDNSKGN